MMVRKKNANQKGRINSIIFFHAACKLCADWTTYAHSTGHNPAGFISHMKLFVKFYFYLILCYKAFFLDMQYLKHIHPTTHHVLERYALLLCVAVIWAFAAILTVAGAYNNVKTPTQLSCRTDRSYLMSSAPWYVNIIVALTICMSLNTISGT